VSQHPAITVVAFVFFNTKLTDMDIDIREKARHIEWNLKINGMQTDYQVVSIFIDSRQDIMLKQRNLSYPYD
jgi:hypothetical protein